MLKVELFVNIRMSVNRLLRRLNFVRRLYIVGIVMNVGNICKIKSVFSLFFFLIKFIFENVYAVGVVMKICKNVILKYIIKLFLIYIIKLGNVCDGLFFFLKSFI